MSATQRSGRKRVGRHRHARILRHADRRRVDEPGGAARGCRHVVAQRRHDGRQGVELRLAARSVDRSGSRSKISICPAPRSQSARATALPAPPAPRRRTRSSAAPRIAERKLSAKPQQSVLWPMDLPPSNTTVFTAPIAAASGDSSSRWAMMLCLKGWVTLRPAKPCVAASVEHGSQGGFGQTQLVEIDQGIRIVEPEPRAFRHMHPGRPRFLDAAADQRRAQLRLRQRLEDLRGHARLTARACARRHDPS